MRLVVLIGASFCYNCTICYILIVNSRSSHTSITTNTSKVQWIRDFMTRRSFWLWLVMKPFNTCGLLGGNCCYPTSDHPSHSCQGVANDGIPRDCTVPCGLGDPESGNLFKLIVCLMPDAFTPAIIVGTMVTMYRTLLKFERKMRTNYCGTSALRLRSYQRQVRVVDDPAMLLLLEEGTITQVLLYSLLHFRANCVSNMRMFNIYDIMLRHLKQGLE